VNELILASQSPRRRELMRLLGHPFRCVSPHVEEFSVPGETPAEHVVRLSLLKAREAAAREERGTVIGSDTVVVLDGDILEKPESDDDAFAMLSRLQGRTHAVYSGFAIRDAVTGEEYAGYEITEVSMRHMDADLIRKYIATGEPRDKAGAYGIQGYGAALITAVRGCYFNVMGLPLSRLMDALLTFTHGAIGYFGSNAETRT